MGPDRPGEGRFPTTRWSAVHGVRSSEPAERERSWEALVSAYWKPAYKHVRVKWRASPEEAEDLVQGFFERAVGKDFFATYEAEQTRFRSFFRLCLDRYVQNEKKAESREKRGGGKLSLDFDAAEQELAKAGAAAWESPEDCFDREWKRALFALGVEALEKSCRASGKSIWYTVFARYDLSERETRPTYEELGRELGIPATTVTNHLTHARSELRRIVLENLADITDGDEEHRAETRVLLG